MAKKICRKCGGKGFIEKYRRDGGKCFECSGTGFATASKRKSPKDERPVRPNAEGIKPLSNKGYSGLLVDDLLRVDYNAISDMASMKEYRTALKKEADRLGIPYKYATPTRTLVTMIQEALNK